MAYQRKLAANTSWTQWAMGIRSFFRRLGGSGGDETPSSAPVGDPVEYRDYVIRATPKREGGHFYTAGTITKNFPDGPKEKRFIRADTHTSTHSAREHAITKAKQIIDEYGDKIFDDV